MHINLILKILKKMETTTEFIIICFISYVIFLNFMTSENISRVQQLAGTYEMIQVKFFINFYV